MKEPISERQLAGMLAMIEERNRLEKLTNVELVAECVQLDAADYAVVEEMMTRLDPTWFEEKDANSLPCPNERSL